MTLTEVTTSRSERIGRFVAATLTLGNAACGFLALAVLVGSEPRTGSALTTAAILIFGAWICDILDGRVARRLRATSAFGAAMDSLCDVISFGVAPAVLVTVAGISAVDPRSLGVEFALAAGFTFLAAAVFRLARFTGKAIAVPPVTTQPGAPRKSRFFEGLPAPAAGLTVASFVLMLDHSPVIAVVAVVLGLAMVSRLPYPDVPRSSFGGYPWAELAATVALALIVNTATGLVAFASYYFLTGPMLAWRRRHRAYASS